MFPKHLLLSHLFLLPTPLFLLCLLLFQHSWQLSCFLRETNNMPSLQTHSVLHSLWDFRKVFYRHEHSHCKCVCGEPWIIPSDPSVAGHLISSVLDRCLFQGPIFPPLLSAEVISGSKTLCPILSNLHWEVSWKYLFLAPIIWACSHLHVVMSTISWSLSSLLNTWASVTDPYMDMNLEPSCR